MACACKAKKAGQVTAVKQVVKKVPSTVKTTQNAGIKRTTVVKRGTYKRPI